MKVHTANILKSTVIATAGALLSSSPAFSATLTNGDFEIGTISAVGGLQVVAPGDSTTINSWTAIAGNQGGGALYQGKRLDNGNDRFKNNGVSSRTVQLNANNTQGGIQTLVSGLNVGVQNIVSVFFELSGNPSTPAVKPFVSVSLFGAGSAQFFGLNSNNGFVTVLPAVGSGVNLLFEQKVATFTFTPTDESAILSFTSQSGNGFGPIIDNVSLTAVPFEFSPLTGFIAGGVLFGSYKLIKRKKVTA